MADGCNDARGSKIVGSERHESRRIDNQLRGRSGRQGDPGASKFFVSLEDDLMRIFGSQRMESMLQRLGLKAGPAAPWGRTPRNAPCPCGSGKKFKHCHGRV